MAQSFKFAIVRLSPEGVRDERINVGVAVFTDESIDVRLPRRLDKIRVISASLDQVAIEEMTYAMASRDLNLRQSGIVDAEGRTNGIGRIGPLTLSQLGTFTASDERQYEARIAAIFRSIVDPEPAPKVTVQKNSRVLSQLKRALREQRVLARADEDLASHRVVQNLPLADGLVADLVLKNGKMHIFETVDISADTVTARKAVSDIAVSALVLEQARINFGEKQTSAKLVYEASSSVEKAARSCLDAAAHQGAELINWASTQDKIKLVTTITQLARPSASRKSNARFINSEIPWLKLA